MSGTEEMLDEYEEKINEQDATITELRTENSEMHSAFDSMKELEQRFENGEISQDEYNSAIKQYLNNH